MIRRIEKRRKTFQVSMMIVIDENMDEKYPINEANVENVLDNSEWLSNMFGREVDIVDVSAHLLDKETIMTDIEYEDGIDPERR